MESQLDQVTDDRVAYEWWLAGSKGRSPAAAGGGSGGIRRGRGLAVVLDLCGTGQRSIRCQAKGRLLTVTADGAGRSWCSEVELPAPVSPTPVAQQYRNGILSIQLAGRNSEMYMESTMTLPQAETSAPSTAARIPDEGRYVYCIMPDIGKDEWGAVGLNGETRLHNRLAGHVRARARLCHRAVPGR